MEYKYADITQKILRAALNVHSESGNGFQEVIYQRALAIEFELMNIKFAREFTMPVYYKTIQVGERRVDFFLKKRLVLKSKL